MPDFRNMRNADLGRYIYENAVAAYNDGHLMPADVNGIKEAAQRLGYSSAEMQWETGVERLKKLSAAMSKTLAEIDQIFDNAGFKIKEG